MRFARGEHPQSGALDGLCRPRFDVFLRPARRRTARPSCPIRFTPGAPPSGRAFFFASTSPRLPFLESPMNKRATKRLVREGELDPTQFSRPMPQEDAKVRRFPTHGSRRRPSRARLAAGDRLRRGPRSGLHEDHQGQVGRAVGPDRGRGHPQPHPGARPGRHRQDLPRHRQGGGGAGGQQGGPHRALPPGGRGRREPRLPAGRHGGQARPLPAPTLRRPFPTASP